MTCYHPIKGYWSKDPHPKSGNHYFTLKTQEACVDLKMEVPCGRCIGCRIKRSKDWAIRCVHEASLHEKNCFITLTYNEEHVPPSLVKRDFQLFMKRLRRAYPLQKIRYFHCGEYGSVCKNCGLSERFCFRRGCQKYVKALGRPHFHACLFGFDFDDKELWQIKNGNHLYRSPSLEKIWSHPETKKSYGFSTVGAVTFESAAYVARYVLKKFNNKNEEKVKEHYGDKLPEYTTMSRRDGIGKKWLDKYLKDVYQSDFVLNNKLQKLKPPRYYDNIYDVIDHKSMLTIKAQRLKILKQRGMTQKEIQAAEEIQARKLKKLIREFEGGNSDG